MENFLSRLHFNKKILLELFILVILLGLIVFIVFKYYRPNTLTGEKPAEQTAEQQPTPTPLPSPCIPKILPGGKQVYRYSHGKDVIGPKLQIVTIDPFDPQSNQVINVTAEIKHDSPVTKATATLVTDNKSAPAVMELVSGEPANGTWAVQLQLEDSYRCTYQLNFDLQSKTGNYIGGMTFRP